MLAGAVGDSRGQGGEDIDECVSLSKLGEASSCQVASYVNPCIQGRSLHSFLLSIPPDGLSYRVGSAMPGLALFFFFSFYSVQS